MTNYFIIPGLGNSGIEHWQSFFEKAGDNFHRIMQKEWDTPNCNEWIANIDRAISNYDPLTIVLIGHSLGCSTIAHWAIQFKKQIKGALLVAPSDIEAPQYNFPTIGFKPIPQNKINFKTIVVASEDDPWVTIDRAKFFAKNWGSDFISIGKAGHINTLSGYGQWQQGLKILKTIN